MSEIRRPERRQHPRTKVKWPATASTPQGDIEGQVENIGPEGAFLISCQEQKTRLQSGYKERDWSGYLDWLANQNGSGKGTFNTHFLLRLF